MRPIRALTIQLNERVFRQLSGIAYQGGFGHPAFALAAGDMSAESNAGIRKPIDRDGRPNVWIMTRCGFIGGYCGTGGITKLDP